MWERAWRRSVLSENSSVSKGLCLTLPEGSVRAGEPREASQVPPHSRSQSLGRPGHTEKTHPDAKEIGVPKCSCWMGAFWLESLQDNRCQHRCRRDTQTPATWQWSPARIPSDQGKPLSLQNDREEEAGDGRTSKKNKMTQLRWRFLCASQNSPWPQMPRGEGGKEGENTWEGGKLWKLKWLTQGSCYKSRETRRF